MIAVGTILLFAEISGNSATVSFDWLSEQFKEKGWLAELTDCLLRLFGLSKFKI